MEATNWEFKNRATVFGLIFGLSFSTYFIDPQNSTATLANWIEATRGVDASLIARLLFALAACLLVVAALFRTWASSYLQANVVYAAEVKTASLVADGPYRHVRNPLYFANVLLALGMGAMMSRTGFCVAVIAMLGFCYRLIFREESELQASQGEQYQRYLAAVPRLWPSFQPRTASSEKRAMRIEGFKAEFWCWGFAVSVAAFAITLNTTVFFVVLGASIAVFWVTSSVLQKSKTRGSA